jgi:hypothetical protein
VASAAPAGAVEEVVERVLGLECDVAGLAHPDGSELVVAEAAPAVGVADEVASHRWAALAALGRPCTEPPPLCLTPSPPCAGLRLVPRWAAATQGG